MILAGAAEERRKKDSIYPKKCQENPTRRKSYFCRQVLAIGGADPA
jgi:hypothetical protein